MTPLGIFFESHRGIELLPRGLGPPTFIGAPVQDQLALRPTILDATFHVGEDATTVRFLVSGPEPTRPVFDAVSSDGRTAADGISFSFNHTLAAGNNRVVIVALTLDSLTGYGGVTASFNGVPMTEVASQLSAAVSGIVVFMLFDAALPFAGGSYSVAVTGVTSSVGTSAGMNAVCLSYLGAKQSAPSVASSSVASSVISDSLAMGAASLGVDFVSATSNNGTRSADAGQTERVNIEVGSHATGASEENGTGASVTMGWASTVSTTLTHVILELDPTFESVQDAVLTYDIDAAAWSVDTYPIEAGALGSTPQGLLFANSDLSASPAFLLEDSSLATDDGVFFEGRLRFHHIYPAGMLGMSHVLEAVARVTLDANPTTVNLSLGLDDDTPATKAWVGTNTTSLRYYGKDPGPRSNQATAVQLEAYDSTAGGVTWHGFTLFHEPEPEQSRPLVSVERG